MSKKRARFINMWQILTVCVIIIAPFSLVAIEKIPVKSTVKHCGGLAGFKRNLCEEIVIKRNGYINSSLTLFKKKYSVYERKLQKPLSNISDLVSSYKGKAELICKAPISIRRGSKPVCIKTATFIAYLSEDGARIAVSDLNRVTEQFQLGDRVIAKCANGKWISVSGGPSALIQNGVLSDILVTQLSNGCGSIGSGGASVGPSGVGQSAAAGGASGLSGIDGFNPFCGLPNISAGNASNFAAGVLNHLEKQRAKCETTFLDMLKEGASAADPNDVNTNGTSNPDAVDKASGETIVKNPDGSGTVTVCTQAGCYVRYQKSTDVFKDTSVTLSNGTLTTITNQGTSSGEPNAIKTVQVEKSNKWWDYVWDSYNTKWALAAKGTNANYADRHPQVWFRYLTVVRPLRTVQHASIFLRTL